MLILICSLIALLVSANFFVEFSAKLAVKLNLSAILIGMIIVGFGTSTPEMLVSSFGAIKNNPGIALGNAYGSNILNILLILGITALIKPLKINNQIFKFDLPLLLLFSAIAFYQSSDFLISRFDSIFLLFIFFIYLLATIKKSQNVENDININSETKTKTTSTIFYLILSLMILIISSKFLVSSATEIAKSIGVSDLIIGLTIIALGTSLPELASSTMAAVKGQDDIAVGNIVGSNIFNTLIVIGIAGTIKPISVEETVITRDLPIMIIVTTSLFLFNFLDKKKEKSIGRLAGACYLSIYACYNIVLFK